MRRPPHCVVAAQVQCVAATIEGGFEMGASVRTLALRRAMHHHLVVHKGRYPPPLCSTYTGMWRVTIICSVTPPHIPPRPSTLAVHKVTSAGGAAPATAAGGGHNVAFPPLNSSG